MLAVALVRVLYRGLKLILIPKSGTVHKGIKSFLEFKRRMLPHTILDFNKIEQPKFSGSEWDPPEYSYTPL